jgi:hypothetical protein
MKRLTIKFKIMVSTTIVIVRYCPSIVMEILVMDELSASPGAGPDEQDDVWHLRATI